MSVEMENGKQLNDVAATNLSSTNDNIGQTSITIKWRHILWRQNYGYTHTNKYTEIQIRSYCFGLVACVYADVSELGYNYPQPAPAAPQKSYIPPPPPAPVEQPQNTYIPPPPPAPVEQPQNTYIPPAAPAPVVPENTYIPPAAESHVESVAEDGYRYKTVRRVVYKHRA
ncbi:LOW QUALITY PROTEIN: FH1/FH2 domain-containing protein 1-like [Lucilia sericata]|uniref:LOW QUALITY PROTEIN: FH1/FH2 domain-containing protein 1-like n=1 Tax=Lucilia sericata TaxID=13632 RepID=UPI0018A80A3F|nr:LOW QUALITY PROTEIN: FH1/FH2 domain-containing protein 1-like [Lucilia sericata]